MGRGLISASFVEDALDCLKQNGMDTVGALERSGLKGYNSQPVTAAQYGALWLVIADIMKDEFFGLGARPMRPGSFTLLGHAILHANNLQHGLTQALRFLNIVLDYPRGTLKRNNGLATITLDDGGAPRSAFAYRAYWIILHGISCFLAGRRIPLHSVEFRCAKPDNKSGYSLFFGTQVQFSTACSELRFHEHYLDLPVKRSEKVLKDFLRRAPANLLMRYRHDAGIASVIQKRLALKDYNTWPAFPVLAKQLRIPASTLRRRLANEGRNYQKIKDDLRRSRAEHLLQTNDSIADISAVLGFAEPSAFYRAFHKWTGQSPACYRNKKRATTKSSSE